MYRHAVHQHVVRAACVRACVIEAGPFSEAGPDCLDTYVGS